MDYGRAHGAPLERGLIMIYSYKHRAPPQHCAYRRQGLTTLRQSYEVALLRQHSSSRGSFFLRLGEQICLRRHRV